MSKLKPCPFCGGKADLEVSDYDLNGSATQDMFEISCIKCGISGGSFFDFDECHKKWNTRAPQSEQVNRFADVVIEQQERITELEAQLVDALGDGFYDGYLACVSDATNESFDSYSVKDSDVLRLSEQHESEHRYSTSINASAIDSINVVDFVGMALRHTTIKGEFDFNDVKDAFNYLSEQLRSKCKGGAA